MTAAERYDAVTEEYRRRWGVEYAGRSEEYRKMMMAAIEAAVARERARCAAWVGTPSLSISEIIASIERGDEP